MILVGDGVLGPIVDNKFELFDKIFAPKLRESRKVSVSQTMHNLLKLMRLTFLKALG